MATNQFCEVMTCGEDWAGGVDDDDAEVGTVHVRGEIGVEGVEH